MNSSLKKNCKASISICLVLWMAFFICVSFAQTPTLQPHHRDWWASTPPLCLNVSDVSFSEDDVDAFLQDGTLETKIISAAKPAIRYLGGPAGDPLSFTRVDVSAVQPVASATGYSITFYVDANALQEKYISAFLYVTPSPKPVIEGIRVQTPPQKTVYIAGEDFDATGMSVITYDSKGATADVSAQCAYTAANALKTGTSHIEIRYQQFVTTQPITVNDAPIPITLERIAVTTLPHKTAYLVGDYFAADGMVVTGYYSDGSSLVLNQFTVSPKEALTAKTTDITILANGKSTTFQITVKEPPVEPKPEVPVEPKPEVPVEPKPEVPVEPKPEVPVEPKPKPVSAESGYKKTTSLPASISIPPQTVTNEQPQQAQKPPEAAVSQEELSEEPADTDPPAKEKIKIPAYQILFGLSGITAIGFAITLLPDFYVLYWYHQKKANVRRKGK